LDRQIFSHIGLVGVGDPEVERLANRAYGVSLLFCTRAAPPLTSRSENAKSHKRLLGPAFLTPPIHI
jgi:hypothetical protein